MRTRVASLLLLIFWIFNCHNTSIKPYNLLLPSCYKSGYYKINPLLITIAPVIGADINDYDTILIGDSIMAINQSTEGFITDIKNTQTDAIPGSTSCDYQLILYFINSGPSVKNVIIGTMGGNDLKYKVPQHHILISMWQLIVALRLKFPNAKFVYIQIHPTRNENLNKEARDLSLQILPMLNKSDCWVNPAPLFANLTFIPASSYMFLPNDNVHYNPYIALGVKKIIIDQCKIDF